VALKCSSIWTDVAIVCSTEHLLWKIPSEFENELSPSLILYSTISKVFCSVLILVLNQEDLSFLGCEFQRKDTIVFWGLFLYQSPVNKNEVICHMEVQCQCIHNSACINSKISVVLSFFKTFFIKKV
jgi:hypothetical protein